MACKDGITSAFVRQRRKSRRKITFIIGGYTNDTFKVANEEVNINFCKSSRLTILQRRRAGKHDWRAHRGLYYRSRNGSCVRNTVDFVNIGNSQLQRTFNKIIGNIGYNCSTIESGKFIVNNGNPERSRTFPSGNRNILRYCKCCRVTARQINRECFGKIAIACNGCRLVSYVFRDDRGSNT